MKISNCCGATVIENTDLCSDCKEHCEVEWLEEDWKPKKVTYNGKELK